MLNDLEQVSVPEQGHSSKTSKMTIRLTKKFYLYMYNYFFKGGIDNDVGIRLNP